MSLRDPVPLYSPASNMEAHLLQVLLEGAGIEAAVMEDISPAGYWIGGVASQLHRPKVMVERGDLERARPLVQQYEQQAAERRAAAPTNPNSPAETIAVTCEDCGVTTSFPAAQRGTVQSCPRCLAYLDVGDVDFEGWEAEAETPSDQKDEA